MRRTSCSRGHGVSSGVLPRPAVLGVLVLALLFGSAVVSESAGAVQGYFCGTASNPRYIGFSSRCTHSVYHTGYQRVTGKFVGGGGIFMCSLAKLNSDGSGGNGTPPACDFTSLTNSYCASGYSCSGYATIINQSDYESGPFYGWLDTL